MEARTIYMMEARTIYMMEARTMCNNANRKIGFDDIGVTSAQIEFIKNLDIQLGYDSDERNFAVMSRVAASALITTLKQELEG
jgi:hypothetical protein